MPRLWLLEVLFILRNHIPPLSALRSSRIKAKIKRKFLLKEVIRLAKVLLFCTAQIKAKKTNKIIKALLVPGENSHLGREGIAAKGAII